MRDPRPLDVLGGFDRDSSVVEQIELAEDRAEQVCGERNAGCVELVGLALELREERLTEDGGPEALEEVIEDIGTAAGIGLDRKQISGEKDLVDGRCDLGNHDRVVVVRVVVVSV